MSDYEIDEFDEDDAPFSYEAQCEFNDFVFDAIADLDMEEFEEWVETTDPSGELDAELRQYFAEGAG